MRLAILLALVLSARAGADGPTLPAHVAPLFEKGRVWVYDTAITYWGPDDPKTGKQTRKTDREKVTCKVEAVATRAGAKVSHVTCDKDIYKLHVAGFYAGTPAGLWRVGFDEVPADDDLVAALAEPPLIAAAPKTFEKVTKAGGPDPKHDTLIEGLRTSPKTGGWCLYGDSSKADVDGGRIVQCFAPGVGIESGYNDVGGELNKFEYTVRR